MAEIKKPNLYSNILWIAGQPVTKEWKKFAKSIPVVPKVTTWPWITAPTQINKPLLESMKVQAEAPKPFTPEPVARIWEQTTAWETDIIKQFYDNPEIPMEDKQLISDAIWEGMDRKDAEEYLTTKYSKKDLVIWWWEQQWFLWWVAEKTWEAFMWWLWRIKEAWVWLAEGKYWFWEAVVRWWAWALQSAFSPVSWLLWETIETWIEQIPQDIRTRIKQEATPTIEWVKEWYNSQSPEQKRRLDNIWVWVELLSNFVWAKWVQKATPIIKETWKKAIKTVTPIVTKWTQRLKKWLEEVRINRATNQISKGEDILYEAVNPTTRENKAILKQRVQQLLPYIEKNPIKNSLEEVKARIDTNKIKAWKSIQEYENTVWVKWTVKTNDIIKKLKETYQEKVWDSFINPDEAKISQDLISTLKWFWKEVKDNDLIKIRRAWDKIEKKNKWFMQSAEATSKWDIFWDANKFFREEIKKSNPEYAKYLQEYHKTTTLSDVIEATIQRRVWQTKGWFLKRWLQNVWRIAWSTWWLPWYLWAEALIQGWELLASPWFKLTRWAKMLKKWQETIKNLKPKK